MKEIKIYEIPNIDSIERIDDPYIGMIFYVADIDTYYSVKTLKEINGINMKGSKVVEYVIDEYADFGTGSGGGSGLTSTQLSNIAKIPAIQSTVDALPNNYASKNHTHSEYASSSHRHNASEIDNLPSGGGTGLTTEQAQQLQTAYEHSQSAHVQASDIPSLNGYATETFVTNKISEAQLSGGEVDLSGYATKDELNNKANTSHTHITSDVTDLDLSNIDAASLNGKKLSNLMTKDEYDAIDVKEPNTIYLVDDDIALEGIPSYSVSDAGKVLAVNSTGTGLVWVTLSSSGGGSEEPKTLNSISAVYTQGNTIIYPSTSLDSLKSNLVVTATYSDSSTSVISSGYSLSGNLAVGTSTITVTYSGKTTTFNVTVSEEQTQGGFYITNELTGHGNNSNGSWSGNVLTATGLWHVVYKLSEGITNGDKITLDFNVNIDLSSIDYPITISSVTDGSSQNHGAITKTTLSSEEGNYHYSYVFNINKTADPAHILFKIINRATTIYTINSITKQ